MGGLYTAIGKLASEELPKLTSWARDYAGNMSHEVRTTGPTKDIDAALFNKIKEYTTAKEQIGARLDQPANALIKGLSADKGLIQQFGDAKIADTHVGLTAQNPAHPLLQHTRDLMQADPKNAGKTLSEIMSENPLKAARQAEVQVLGSAHEHITPLFYDLYKSPDETHWSHADAMANIFSSVTHDAKEIQGRGRGGVRVAGTSSSTKLDIQNYTMQMNKLFSSIGGTVAHVPGGKKFLKPIYEAPSAKELAVNKWLRTVSAPFMAIPHIGTLFNLSSTPISLITKGLFSMGDSAFRDHVQSTGVLGSTMHAIMAQQIRAETSKTASLVGHKAADMLSSMIHNPGFHRLRLQQLMFGGAVGHHATQEWARMAVSGNKRAIAELTQMGLDVPAITQRGGVLTNDELKTGIFRYVNDRFFIDKSYERSLYSNSNKWMRTATMFHAFVGFQSNFIRHELGKLIKAGDVASIAQFAGSVGVLFPAVAPMIKSAENLLRTGSPTQAMQGMQQDYQTLTHPEDAKAFLYEYVDMLSYLGAYGVYTHFLQAAENHRLARQVAGPLVGIGAAAGEDLVSGIFGAKHNFEPLGRDVLRYGVPVAGGAIEHQLLPPQPKQRFRFRRRYY